MILNLGYVFIWNRDDFIWNVNITGSQKHVSYILLFFKNSEFRLEFINSVLVLWLWMNMCHILFWRNSNKTSSGCGDLNRTRDETLSRLAFQWIPTRTVEYIRRALRRRCWADSDLTRCKLISDEDVSSDNESAVDQMSGGLQDRQNKLLSVQEQCKGT